MRILQQTTVNGVLMRLEDWQDDFPFFPFADTLGLYPIARRSGEGLFTPRKGKEFRLALVFESTEQALKAYYSLKDGTTTIEDYAENARPTGYTEYLRGY